MTGNYNRNNDRRTGGKPQNNGRGFTVEKLEGDVVQKAENIMSQYANQQITTTKLRSIYSLILDIYNSERSRDDKALEEANRLKLQMIRVRIAYEVGREDRGNAVGTFVENTNLIGYIKWIESNEQGNSRENFMNFARYMEALVAYHRFYGGK